MNNVSAHEQDMEGDREWCKLREKKHFQKYSQSNKRIVPAAIQKNKIKKGASVKDTKKIYFLTPFVRVLILTLCGGFAVTFRTFTMQRNSKFAQ